MLVKGGHDRWHFCHDNCIFHFIIESVQWKAQSFWTHKHNRFACCFQCNTCFPSLRSQESVLNEEWNGSYWKKYRAKNGCILSVNPVYEQICNICTLQSPYDMSVLIEIITSETEMASLGQFFFVTESTRSCHFENFQRSQWRHFC